MIEVPHFSSLQPHKGPSETQSTARRSDPSERFNPTRVRLKRGRCVACSTSRTSFNPTRVRLKRRRSPPQHSPGLRFNPTRVRLKRGASPPQSRHDRRFNPTRVRLKLATRRRREYSSMLQPHKGPSETRESDTGTSQKCCFNPTRVRLKQSDLEFTVNPAPASTPQGSV